MLPLTTIPMAQQSQFYKHQNIEDDDYAYRVTQIVDEPKKKKNPVARSRPSKKKSRRVSSKTYSISTDSGTEMASSPQPLPKIRGQYNRGYSRTPSSSHELDILSVQNLNADAIYARPQRLANEIVVAGQGSFGSMHHLRSHSQVYKSLKK